MKITPQKLPWVILGTFIVIASVLQVITYYSYAKLDRAVQTFISDIREAKDDKEAEEVFIKFVGDSAPLIGKSESGAFLGFGRAKDFISEIPFIGGGKRKKDNAYVSCLETIAGLGGNVEVCNEITK